MIYYFTPYMTGNLGKAYNHYCELVPNDDDWITFSDGDVMQLHLNWGDIWHNVIENNKNAGIITCLTNRVARGNQDQLCADMYNETNIITHRKYAKNLFNQNRYNCKKMIGTFLSGFFFSFTKKTWIEVGGFDHGILNVDSTFYHKVKSIKDCIVANGFYVLHYYRFLEGNKYTHHLKNL